MSSGSATAPILITSFQTWQPYQRSNSSDDVLAVLQAQGRLPADSLWMRNLPVDFELAPEQVIRELEEKKPRLVVCCGMAERRVYLTMEQQAKGECRSLQTSVDLKRVIYRTRMSRVSYDAGNYVCNQLYYSVLENLTQWVDSPTAVFVHIPVLRAGTQHLILRDFATILDRLARL